MVTTEIQKSIHYVNTDTLMQTVTPPPLTKIHIRFESVSKNSNSFSSIFLISRFFFFLNLLSEVYR